MTRASAAKPTVRSLRWTTRRSRARVQRSAPRGRTEAAGASALLPRRRAGPPGRTRRAAVAVSGGEESNSSG